MQLNASLDHSVDLYLHHAVMKAIPITTDALVLRTDFSDPFAWESIQAEVRAPAEFQAHVEFVSDREFDGAPVADLLALIPDDRELYPHDFLFVVDRTTVEQREHPVLVVDLGEERGRCFRVAPSELWGVENNLSISNMDFAEFADAVDDDGVFRGF